MTENVDKNVYEKKTCRLCGFSRLSRVLTLASTPPANALTDAPWPGRIVTYPLALNLCGTCGHVQLTHVVSAEVLYKDYKYTSPIGMREHWRKACETVAAKVGLQRGDRVVEIGSNNGDLLSYYKGLYGAEVHGFEPAEQIAISANLDGIPTTNSFFSEESAEDFKVAVGSSVKLLLANNVLAHIDDLDGAIRGVKALLAKPESGGDRPEGGTFVFEVQYLGDLLAKGLFDLCYHEHVDNHALSPLIPFFHSHGMSVVDVEKIPTHGGSIRVYVKIGKYLTPSHTVTGLLDEEFKARLHTAAPFEKLQKDIAESTSKLHGLLEQLRWTSLNAGGYEPVIVGYGAPAKATTLLFQTGLVEKSPLAYVVDDAPQKQGKYIPGTSLKILKPEALHDAGNVDYVLILAWNYADSIITKVTAEFAKRNARPPKFIIPFPTLQVV